MSGGFFRGTSADQDTRFSNKQAKLLKSQKFPPELDHLVDITKVKMDVIRPWIAARATELLGFEDEVLINFVYGLLDGKGVDGKQIQIQLTGFMEKNTGKFMKELWSLLLSAQKNASGVPQQFLDAKEDEMRKKKAESDRITQEIQKRKEMEGKEVDREKQIRMDGEADISRPINAFSGSASKHLLHRESSVNSEEERELRRGRRAKNGYSDSPHSSKSPRKHHSQTPHRNMPSATRSSSKSFSKSRSYSEEGHKSRSVSVSSQSRRCSISSEGRHGSPAKRSVSPVKRSRSPPRRSISPHRRHSPRNARSPSRRSRRRSASRVRHRSPSPFRRRSPHAYRIASSFLRRRSPTPLHRRSSPSRRRSPVRRRSPSPNRRRSPIRRRSPSPLRRKSPPRRSPGHRRRSPVHSPRGLASDSQLSPQQRQRSRSPYRSRSPSYRTRRSLSRERDSRTNGVESKRYRDSYASYRTHEKRSPRHYVLDREVAEPDSRRKFSDSVSRRLPTSLRSPQRDLRDQSDVRNRVPVVPSEKSPTRSESLNRARIANPRRNRRSRSVSGSPVKHARERVPRHDSPETNREEETIRAREDAHRRIDSFHKSKDLPADKGLKKFHADDINPEVYSPDRSAENQSAGPRSAVKQESRKKDYEHRRDLDLAEGHARRLSPLSEGIEYGPGRVRQESSSPVYMHDRQHLTKKHAVDASSLEEREYDQQTMKHSFVDGLRVTDEKRPSKSDEYKGSHSEKQFVTKSKRKVDEDEVLDMIDSGSEEPETDKYQNMEKRKHKKSDKQTKHKRDADDGSESDSEIEDRKEAKRRRKDEKKLRKEERRRRREERHRRRLERRASKLKAKSMDTVAPPSDIENSLKDSDGSDGDAAIRKDSHPSDTEEPESEQKKLEIELRKKALESLRAKKAISH